MTGPLHTKAKSEASGTKPTFLELMTNHPEDPSYEARWTKKKCSITLVMTKLPSNVKKVATIHSNHSRGIIDTILGLTKDPTPINTP
jgi:hypothetical protein